MRCRVLNCRSNKDGYCMDSSYIEIDEDGECDCMLVIEDIETKGDTRDEV